MDVTETHDKLVKAAVAKLNGELTDFEGQNCETWYADQEECGGWDGVSHRCECGNRRVAWELSYCHTYVYAEAY